MDKQEDFKRLSVMYEIGYQETTSEADGCTRNGKVRYKGIANL